MVNLSHKAGEGEESAVESTRPEPMVIDYRLLSYLTDRFDPHTFFGVWDLQDVMKDLKLMSHRTQHTCMYIAAKMSSGNRTQSKSDFCADPALVIEKLNSRKRKKQDATDGEGWKMIAFVVVDLGSFTVNDLQAKLKYCTEPRRLHERVIRLLTFAFYNDLDMRFFEDIIRKDTRWYMPQVNRFLNDEQHFVEYVSRKFDVMED